MMVLLEHERHPFDHFSLRGSLFGKIALSTTFTMAIAKGNPAPWIPAHA
jgi:hypothetical protein